MTLQLLISTIDNGIEHVAQQILPPQTDVCYLVSWQHSEPDDTRAIPVALQRKDIQVTHLEGRGLSRNRNNCLNHATGDICLICDDDCRYMPDRLQAVLTTFAEHPGVDVATFMTQSEYNHKTYPDTIFDLRHRFTNYYPTSFEIAFRLSSILDKLRFNEHFGLGAPIFQCSEEEIFIHDALSLGLQCRFFPVTIVEHNHPTTEWTRATQPGVLMANGANLFINYRSKMFLYPLPMAWRLHKRHKVSIAYGLRHIYKGLFHILHHRQIATAGILKK